MANTSEMANRKSRIANGVLANGGPSVLSLCVTRHSLLAIRQLAPFATRNPVLLPQPSFAGLVALARRSDPIPSRTRPSNAFAPMVLCLKTWESRSSPGLQRTVQNEKPQGFPLPLHSYANGEVANGEWIMAKPRRSTRRPKAPHSPLANPHSPNHSDAGWSSPVARQAHNLKAAGSNPAPATKSKKAPRIKMQGAFSRFKRPQPAMVAPPSTTRVCPVMNELAREAR